MGASLSTGIAGIEDDAAAGGTAPGAMRPADLVGRPFRLLQVTKREAWP